MTFPLRITGSLSPTYVSVHDRDLSSFKTPKYGNEKKRKKEKGKRKKKKEKTKVNRINKNRHEQNMRGKKPQEPVRSKADYTTPNNTS
jgi:hypothetical protein